MIFYVGTGDTRDLHALAMRLLLTNYVNYDWVHTVFWRVSGHVAVVIVLFNVHRDMGLARISTTSRGV